MPQEIELSIMAADTSAIQPVLDAFEAETKIHVRVTLLNWDTAWGTLVKNAIYHDGPDISEVGSTWIGDLIGMAALRPFEQPEVASAGGRQNFLPVAWKHCQQAGDPSVWALPWLASVRLIFYRPALLQSAGIKAEGAFETVAQFSSTIQKLAEHATPVPWAAATNLTHATLLNIASWVWAGGGELLSADGRTTRFSEQAALDGMVAYFDLGQALPEKLYGHSSQDSDFEFANNPGAAVTASGPWMWQQFRSNPASGICAALPPGPSFVGGSNLVVWKHSHNTAAAVKLARYLTQKEPQLEYSQRAGLLPVRMEALNEPPFTTDPFWVTAVQALETGRTFPVLRLWGLVEDRLTTTLEMVWKEFLRDPSAGARGPVEKLMLPLARKLDAILKQ